MDPFSTFDSESSTQFFSDLSYLSDSSVSTATVIDPWFAVAHPELSRPPVLGGARRRSILKPSKDNDCNVAMGPPAHGKLATTSAMTAAKAPAASPTAPVASAAAEGRMAELAIFKARKAAEKALMSSGPPSKRPRAEPTPKAAAAPK
jgi:hypothetical protein